MHLFESWLDDMAEAIYAHLSNDAQNFHIRILDLLPRSHGQKLEAALRTVSLRDASRKYEALSYTWGGNAKPRSLVIAGTELMIGLNLFEALHALRLTDTARPLWIDALCINQNDETEKTLQVANMGKVYEFADRAVVWLGRESPEQDFIRSASFFHWLVPIFETRYPNARDPRDTYTKAPESDSYVNVTGVIAAYNSEGRPDHLPELSLPVLQSFYQRPWFTRRWVLQEIHNARQVVIRCGASIMPWDLFADAMSLPLDIGTWMPHAIAKIHGRLGVGVIDILQTLESYDAFRCQDDRDRIAALLNFRAFRLMRYDEFKVDYKLSVEENYIVFAKYLADGGRSLSLLVHASKRTRKPLHQRTLPSWVPDWRIAPHAPAHALDCYGWPVRFKGNGLLILARLTARLKNTPGNWELSPPPGGIKPLSQGLFVPSATKDVLLPEEGDLVCDFDMFDGSPAPSFVLRRASRPDTFHLICECLPIARYELDCFEDIRTDMIEITIV